MAGTTIPQWQVDQLYTMGQSGQLAGVDPSVLVGIDQAESKGSPGAADSVGDGGYFGLNQDQAPSIGQDSQAEFSAEAPIAAQDFATQQQQFGSNYLAEEAYQSGPNTVTDPAQYGAPTTEGVTVFQGLGIPASPQGPYPSLAGSGSTQESSSSVPLLGSGNVLPTWGPTWAPWNWGADAGNATIDAVMPYCIVAVGLLLVVWGIDMTFRGGSKVNVQLTGGPSTSRGPGVPAGRGAVGDTEAAAEDAAAAP